MVRLALEPVSHLLPTLGGFSRLPFSGHKDEVFAQAMAWNRPTHLRRGVQLRKTIVYTFLQTNGL